MINPFKSKKGLGRGLSSLIGDTDIKVSNDKISISSIVPNKNQPRKFFEKEALTELKSEQPQIKEEELANKEEKEEAPLELKEEAKKTE